MLIRIDGELSPGVTSKDIILHVCGLIGTAGGTGYTIEFDGSAIHSLSMEARMSISNMAIEAGARAGIIAPDEITFEYLKGRPMCPTGDEWDKAVEYWKSLASDENAVYDKTVVIDAKDIAPTVTWGTSPQDVTPITGNVPMIADSSNVARQVSNDARLILKRVLASFPYSRKRVLVSFSQMLFLSHNSCKRLRLVLGAGCNQALVGIHWTRRGTKD
jgi:3-isopropylmalate dehydratase